MKSLHLFTFLSLLPLAVLSTVLVDYDAARGDAPSVMGHLNIEKAKGDRPKTEDDSLFIRTSVDPAGTPAAHFHRAKGNIRTEYHAMFYETEADKTYYIGYSFSLGVITHNLVLFQWKEFIEQELQRIPLNLEFDDDVLTFNYQAPGVNTKRVRYWGKKLEVGVKYDVGFVIHTGRSSETGWARLYWDGKPVKLEKGGYYVNGTMFQGQTDPKFGAYRGEEVEIDTYVYNVKIGSTWSDVKDVTG
ncbi:hypothetical protein EDC01DRAFT_698921, partial [Geopyxis carbonaria]